MTYKLIHKETKEEYICSKVVISNFDYFLSNLVAENGNWTINHNNQLDIFGHDYAAIFTLEQIKNCKKIVATNNIKLLIPHISEYTIINNYNENP